MILINKVYIDNNHNYNLTMTQTFNLTALLFITLVYASSAHLMRGERELNVVSTPTPIPCNPMTSGNSCVCPGKCLTYQNSTGGCHPNDCWKWDNVNDKCEVAGKDFVGPIVLQSIPFTGAFGSGWGNMGRWDIFNIYMAVVFGPFAVLLVACCCAMGGFCAQNEDRVDCCKCAGSCFGCLWAIAVVVLWIWGIVEIANKPMAPWTDWQGNPIECALVG